MQAFFVPSGEQCDLGSITGWYLHPEGPSELVRRSPRSDQVVRQDELLEVQEAIAVRVECPGEFTQLEYA